jgi:hypothetical protein
MTDRGPQEPRWWPSEDALFEAVEALTRAKVVKEIADWLRADEAAWIVRNAYREGTEAGEALAHSVEFGAPDTTKARAPAADCGRRGARGWPR